MNNIISYVASKNNTMAHSMSLNNRISCVVGISIFGFKTYWKQVFDLMEIQTTPTFKQFLKAETIKANKNKSYYQRYDFKRLRAFHRQAMIKQRVNNNMLARRSGMDYSPGIQFKQVPSIWKRHKNSQWKIKKATKVVPVWLHQALMGYFKGLACGTCN